MRRTWLVAATLPLLLVAGCDRTNFEPSIYRDRTPDNADTGYVITDAKQRIVLNVPQYRPVNQDGTTKYMSRRIQCAEPSPDVAQALSEAVKFAAEAEIRQQSGTSGSGRLGFANSFSSSIAQLGERLAAIQLLRDKMYRACEAYANGAVGASGYTLMLARLDKSMVTMLATEMTAGAFGRSLAALAGVAGTGGVDPDELAKAKAAVTAAAKKLEDASKIEKKEDREAAVAKASGELSAANEKLFALEIQSARTSAASNTAMSAIGQITGRSGAEASGTIPASIAEMHRNFLDDHGLEPLIDACVVAMDSITPSAKAQERVRALLAAAPTTDRSGTQPDVDSQLY